MQYSGTRLLKTSNSFTEDPLASEPVLPRKHKSPRAAPQRIGRRVDRCDLVVLRTQPGIMPLDTVQSLTSGDHGSDVMNRNSRALEDRRSTKNLRIFHDQFARALEPCNSGAHLCGYVIDMYSHVPHPKSPYAWSGEYSLDHRAALLSRQYLGR